MVVNELAARALFNLEAENVARLVQARHGILYSREFPVLDIGMRAAQRPELRLLVDATDWNDRPPSMALLSATGDRLPSGLVPRHPGGVFNSNAHPVTGHPFVCMAGVLEYHTHTSHLQDHWSNYRDRSSHSLAGIVIQVWNAWLHSSP